VQELAARLSANIPAAGSGAASSEIAILQRAIRSGGRMLPIRKLFDSIPNLLRRMCPCMLMSPISVAQYIDPAFPKFDLVIFDEASQLPTSEAVGAIARGDNVIVVGDPRQLPPTSFFSANHVDEAHYEQEDLESVLDDCLALSMPQKHLLWHYRSRHESLIAFSNARFYENKLLTFPSPADPVSEVKWVHVDGCYDKGKTKQNPAEARAVVDEIVSRLRDEARRQESIGVVTFSVVQQILIDDMLAEEFMKDPKLEEYANAII
jgi:superfamily I DNA and/or RNA helicase